MTGARHDLVTVTNTYIRERQLDHEGPRRQDEPGALRRVTLQSTQDSQTDERHGSAKPLTFD